MWWPVWSLACVCVSVCVLAGLWINENLRWEERVITTCMQMTSDTKTHSYVHTHRHTLGLLLTEHSWKYTPQQMQREHSLSNTLTHSLCLCLVFGLRMRQCAAVWVASGDTAALCRPTWHNVIHTWPSVICAQLESASCRSVRQSARQKALQLSWFIKGRVEFPPVFFSCRRNVKNQIRMKTQIYLRSNKERAGESVS